MDEAKRRQPVEVKGDVAAICSRTAAYLLKDSVNYAFLFGPVVCGPAQQWGFIVVSCDRTDEVWHYQLNAETEADAVALRAGLMNALDVGLPWTEDINDELEVAKAAEAFWPYAKTRTRQGIGKRKWRTQ
jgi:hypothetical protein